MLGEATIDICVMVGVFRGLVYIVLASEVMFDIAGKVLKTIVLFVVDVSSCVVMVGSSSMFSGVSASVLP